MLVTSESRNAAEQPTDACSSEELLTPAARLQVQDLSIAFPSPHGYLSAVSDVSFEIGAGEVLGLVGESGSGKSVTGLALLGLLPTAKVSGVVSVAGQSILDRSEREMRAIRGSKISMIFQEPMTALNPVFTVGQQMAATLRAHRKLTRRSARSEAIELLGHVGIPAPQRRIDEYPHQLSGGMRQRVMIAMAISCEPLLLIADEPTTALDVTIQAQILDLLQELSQVHGTSILLITHDLGVVAETCRRVLTMYAGQIVEAASVDDVLAAPRHPYTSGLVRAIPRVATGKTLLHSIPGRVPSLETMPTGCRFAPRCEHVQDRCLESQELRELTEQRYARCCRAEELSLPGGTSE